MEQVKSFCRRYRRLLLAAAYLAIFAVGVLYLRVTVNIPPEGDDKLTLNLWLYDFQRMPFWQYALQDLRGGCGTLRCRRSVFSRSITRTPSTCCFTPA